MPPIKELTGVVSIDLRNEPQFPFDPNAAAIAAQGLTVDSEESYAIAARMIQQAAACIGQVEDFFEKDKSLAHLLHKSICDKITKFTVSWRSVRPNLESKMKTFRKQQEDLRRAEEDRTAREANAARIKAEAEAAEIRRRADEEAARLRREGEMRQAREVVTQATEQAAQVVETSDSLADLGVIAPAPPKLASVGESRPWVGVIDDTRLVLKAIVDGELSISAEDYTKLQALLTPILTRIAKRLQKEDIGVAGAHGERDVTLRFSKSPVQAGHAAQGEDGW